MAQEIWCAPPELDAVLKALAKSIARQSPRIEMDYWMKKGDKEHVFFAFEEPTENPLDDVHYGAHIRIPISKLEDEAFPFGILFTRLCDVLHVLAVRSQEKE